MKAESQTSSQLKRLLHSTPQALQTQSFSTLHSCKYADAMGAITGDRSLDIAFASLRRSL
jgi:hypothetical protein